MIYDEKNLDSLVEKAFFNFYFLVFLVISIIFIDPVNGRQNGANNFLFFIYESVFSYTVSLEKNVTNNHLKHFI